MSILDLKPSAVPVELRVKIAHVMRKRNLSWRNAILSLALEVVSPLACCHAPCDSCARKVVSPAVRTAKARS